MSRRETAPPFPRRKPPPRLARDCYVGRRLTFITICTNAPAIDLTAGSVPANIAFAIGETAARIGHMVEAWVIMPDHLHVLLFGLSADADAAAWVQQFKARTAMAYKRRTGTALWQRSFYDRALRSEDAVEAVCTYIWANLLRKGLCRDWRAWPWSGGRYYERLLQEFRDNAIPKSV